MKRLLLAAIVGLFITSDLSSQIINFSRTLPIRSYSITVAPFYNFSNTYHPNLEGLSVLVAGGYGFGYNIDLGIKYGYYGGKDLFAADVQYLFRETRNSYYSLYGGIHRWEEYGIDLAVSFTHTPVYWLNLTVGIDLDTDITAFELRAWVPLNVTFNFDDKYYVFLEYDLPGTERSWDIIGAGITFVIR
ncbi:MAG: hypothetical protein K9J30_06100 [Bacteroidales bacterium]|nr:hypothetical protein [Bacteroidales bacterium]